ncbi:pyridoxamine 5'-phosphate oxidase family protein [Nocardioides sp.]|uniref:pyridoxamine 5'-phosphate oxidase family protein n=1 Tax=Nocardioides sp. TaxID=35761 RepID=UPI00356607C0
MADSLVLGTEECRTLLNSGVVGRIAVSTPDGPHIVPVNYAVVDDSIVVRTSAYSLLGTYGRDSTLAFEVDHVDHEQQHGWSVVARGRGEFVTDDDELDHIQQVWDPRPWATGVRALYLRLTWSELSGRRLGEGWDTRAGGVRRVV